MKTEMLYEDEIATMCGIGIEAFCQLRREGRIPAAIDVGGTGFLRWRRSDIEEWFADGCPDVRQGWKPSGSAPCNRRSDGTCQEPRLLCLESTLRMLGINHSQFHDLIWEYELPLPVVLTGSPFWKTAELEDWVRSLTSVHPDKLFEIVFGAQTKSKATVNQSEPTKES